MKATVAKTTEKLPENAKKLLENSEKLTEYLRRVGSDKGGFWKIIE